MRWVMGFQFSQLSFSALSPKFPRWLLRCHHGCVFFQEILILLSYWRDRNSPLKDKYFPHNPPKNPPTILIFLQPPLHFLKNIHLWLRCHRLISRQGTGQLSQRCCPTSPVSSVIQSQCQCAAPIIVCNLRIWSCWLLVCWTWAQPRAPSV